MWEVFAEFDENVFLRSHGRNEKNMGVLMIRVDRTNFDVITRQIVKVHHHRDRMFYGSVPSKMKGWCQKYP